MPRYYYNGNVRYAHRGTDRIDEILNRLHVVTWDAKKHKHNFVGIGYEDEYRKNGWAFIHGVPFAFENEVVEREFLDYHPDAKDLRRIFNRYFGYCVECKIEAINYEDLPIYKKGNRWFWKK